MSSPVADELPPRQGASTDGHTAWALNFGAPIRSFLRAETGGALMLLGAAVAALIWANLPLHHSYETVWSTKLAISLGSHRLSLDLREWVNKGLMTIFFLVVGLEAKRELDLGELRERTRIGIPVAGALGGMVCAAGIYLAFNAGRPGGSGWGAAMSTDTALSLGVLTLVGAGATARLRVFLLTLVVVDDLISLIVIAIAYTKHVAPIALLIAVVLFAAMFLLRFLGRRRNPGTVLLGLGVWLALLKSGIDPVVSGLAVGLVTDAYLPARDDLERATEITRSFREQPTPELARSAQQSLAAAVSANERLQYVLHPWTSFVIVPLFALANAGIRINGGLLGHAFTSPVSLGVILAFVVGKPIGITVGSLVATRMPGEDGRLPITWPGLIAAGSAAGLGFTVSLLIASLALHGQMLSEAKLGLLIAAVISPALAWAAFRIIARLPETVRARQLVRTVPALIDLAEDVDPDRDHIRGQESAPVTLVEYADFECPYCGRAEPAVRDLLVAKGHELRYVFRHLPLRDVHPRAEIAAEASEAAAAQGRFWEMHDMLMDNQDDLSPRALLRYAEQIGLDVERFQRELFDHRYAERVAGDMQGADASGVSGTPSFFVNGRRLHGAYDLAALTAAVNSARQKALAVQLASL